MGLNEEGCHYDGGGEGIGDGDFHLVLSPGKRAYRKWKRGGARRARCGELAIVEHSF